MPSVQDILEVEWTKFITPKFLKEAKENKSLTFVDEFFDDLAIAQKAIKQIF